MYTLTSGKIEIQIDYMDIYVNSILFNRITKKQPLLNALYADKGKEISFLACATPCIFSVLGPISDA